MFTGRVRFTARRASMAFDVHVHLAFVVAGAASIEISVALGGFKRRRVPQIQRVRRLNVIVPVATGL